MGCRGSKSNLKSSLDSLSIKQQYQATRSGFIQFDYKTIQFLKENDLIVREKLRQRCEKKLIKKNKLQSSSFKTSLLNTTASKRKTCNLKINRSNVSLREVDTLEIKKQMIDLAISHVIKYALNDYQLDTSLSLDQLRNNIILYNSIISPDYSMYSIGSANLVDSNNNVNNGEPDNRFYKKALDVAVDELDDFLCENSVLINELKSKGNKNGVVIEDGEVVVKLKDALDIARHMFYEGKYSTIYSTRTGGYVVRETQLPNGATIENHQVTSFVNEAKQLKAKYLEQNTPISITNSNN